MSDEATPNGGAASSHADCLTVAIDSDIVLLPRQTNELMRKRTGSGTDRRDEDWKVKR